MQNVVVIGAGMMGSTHITAYREIKNVKVLALVDSNEQKGKELCDKHSLPFYKDLDSALADLKVKGLEVNLVDICLPTFLHKDFIFDAAKKGLNIICEKPISYTKKDLEEILECVKSHHVRLHVAQVIRFWPEYQKAKDLLDNGTLGELKSGFASRRATFPSWSAWFADPKLSGGGLLDLHIHDIDYMCYLLGPIASVKCAASKDEKGAINYLMTTLTAKSGKSVMVEGIISMPKSYPFAMEMRLVGTKGTFEYLLQSGDANIEGRDSGVRKSTLYTDSNIENYDTPQDDAYVNELKVFVECLEKGVVCEKVSYDSLLRTMSVIDAIRESVETGKEVFL